MLLCNGKLLNFPKFPDGTTSFKFNTTQAYLREEDGKIEMQGGYTKITWLYDSDEELVYLWYLVSHIRDSIPEREIWLNMPYIPNARMDRVKNNDDVFTLKHFAKMINSMNFGFVTVYDPHSDVAPALFDRVCVRTPEEEIKKAIAYYEDPDILICYPDNGSAKRYSDLVKRDYVFCIKHRDWATGKITDLTLTDPDKVKGKNILIVDDICSKGGTFTYTAQALKKAGAERIGLWVSHCENTVHKGSVLTDGLIEHVHTTNSIFRQPNEKTTVIKLHL